MKIKKAPEEIWKEYSDGVGYKTRLNLFETVEENEDFYNDKQWEGVIAPDLVKPVFNFLKPAVNYYIAMLISDDIAVNVEILNANPDAPADVETAQKVISQEIENVIEQAGVKNKNRKSIRNCAVDGDCCIYWWFDTESETDTKNTGAIKADLIDNTDVFFGNPSTGEAEGQPYIILRYKKLTEDVKDEAEENGEDPEEITPDIESTFINSNDDLDNDYTTVLLKMWKEEKEVHIIKVTRDAVVMSERNTGYRRYPLSYWSWEAVKNSCHGVSPITGKIENQRFVNKLFAMSMVFTEQMAFPKMLYDKTKLRDGWKPGVNQQIGVVGNPQDAMLASFSSRDMNQSAPNMIDATIKYSKELMGANDSALGNIKPDNTSAIIAVQKAAGMQLDLQRMDFYDYVESGVRVMIDIMRLNYGPRNVLVTDNDGNRGIENFDFNGLSEYAMNLNIDIGQGSYWSELMQIQTLDNMMEKQIIPDRLTYLESLPDGYVKNKQDIINKIKELQAQKAGGGQMLNPDIPQVPEQLMQGGNMPQGQLMGQAEQPQGISDEEAAAIAQKKTTTDWRASRAGAQGQTTTKTAAKKADKVQFDFDNILAPKKVSAKAGVGTALITGNDGIDILLGKGKYADTGGLYYNVNSLSDILLSGKDASEAELPKSTNMVYNGTDKRGRTGNLMRINPLTASGDTDAQTGQKNADGTWKQVAALGTWSGSGVTSEKEQQLLRKALEAQDMTRRANEGRTQFGYRETGGVQGQATSGPAEDKESNSATDFFSDVGEWFSDLFSNKGNKNSNDGTNYDTGKNETSGIDEEALIEFADKANSALKAYDYLQGGDAVIGGITEIADTGILFAKIDGLYKDVDSRIDNFAQAAWDVGAEQYNNVEGNSSKCRYLGQAMLVPLTQEQAKIINEGDENQIIEDFINGAYANYTHATKYGYMGDIKGKYWDELTEEQQSIYINSVLKVAGLNHLKQAYWGYASEPVKDFISDTAIAVCMPKTLM